MPHLSLVAAFVVTHFGRIFARFLSSFTDPVPYMSSLPKFRRHYRSPAYTVLVMFSFHVSTQWTNTGLFLISAFPACSLQFLQRVHRKGLRVNEGDFLFLHRFKCQVLPTKMPVKSSNHLVHSDEFVQLKQFFSGLIHSTKPSTLNWMPERKTFSRRSTIRSPLSHDAIWLEGEGGLFHDAMRHMERHTKTISPRKLCMRAVKI